MLLIDEKRINLFYYQEVKNETMILMRNMKAERTAASWSTKKAAFKTAVAASFFPLIFGGRQQSERPAALYWADLINSSKGFVRFIQLY